MTNVLGPRFADALTMAVELHGGDWRKGAEGEPEKPYIGHLLGVASTVIEAHGSEDQVIGALLHDAVEDHADSGETIALIEDRFGSAVAGIVVSCSDNDQDIKGTWLERKGPYLERLRAKDPADPALLVVLADKYYNARAILRDLDIHADELWERFRKKELPDETPADIARRQLWYYRHVEEILRDVEPAWLANEFSDAVGHLGAKIEGG